MVTDNCEIGVGLFITPGVLDVLAAAARGIFPLDLQLGDFPGPIHVFHWARDQHPDCEAQRRRWLEELQATRKGKLTENYQLEKEDEKILTAAMAARTDVTDEEVSLSGVPYDGGTLRLTIGYNGADPYPINTWAEDQIKKDYPAWYEAAAMKRSTTVKVGAMVGFAALGLLLLIGAILKARPQGTKVARWEVVGEAEDLDITLDPNDWNATIFQLTAAMPALAEFEVASQLGPSGKGGIKPESTVGAPAPISDTPSDESIDAVLDAAVDESIDEAVGAESTSASPQPSPDEEVAASTGMTVGMAVPDDGTDYDANRPLEIGVLQFGRPVGQKTKRFRKVFSIGRATDNRVVIQDDDTVHRYHVVIRPAMQGAEWWLDVSPSTSNRTSLNGKDLRAAGRYRLPAKFRLQLGEATEVRGGLSEDEA